MRKLKSCDTRQSRQLPSMAYIRIRSSRFLTSYLPSVAYVSRTGEEILLAYALPGANHSYEKTQEHWVFYCSCEVWARHQQLRKSRIRSKRPFIQRAGNCMSCEESQTMYNSRPYLNLDVLERTTQFKSTMTRLV